MPPPEKLTQTPGLCEVLDSLADEVRYGLRVMMPGVVQSYDPDKRTAKVQPCFKRVGPDGETSSYPLLVDVPVFTLQGGGAAVSFPISKDDECVVIFADRNLEAWAKNGGQAAPADARCHHLSDGIALVGLNSQANAPHLALAADEAGLSDDKAVVVVKGGKVRVANDQADLLTLLSDLVTQLQNMDAGNGDNSIISLLVQLVTILLGATTVGGDSFSVATKALLTTLNGKLATLSASSLASLNQTATNLPKLLYTAAP
ncbi:MAG: Gp138 family membrane-puncturing spike protein [Elusimicrobia bacterium]|nr:Gp138 family membrane-puncturing spike protein [Elusimicrobiota bacterium]